MNLTLDPSAPPGTELGGGTPPTLPAAGIEKKIGDFPGTGDKAAEERAELLQGDPADGLGEEDIAGAAVDDLPPRVGFGKKGKQMG